MLDFAWYDSSSHSVKFASKEQDGDWSAVQTLASGDDVGQYLSIDLDASGRPGVAYYDSSTAKLDYTYFTGSGWSTEAVATHGKVGLYPSLWINGYEPIITYYDKTVGSLDMAVGKGEGGVNGWTLTTVDQGANGDDVGRYSSFAISNTGTWSVAYSDTTSGDVRFAKLSGSTWSITTVDTSGDQGVMISLNYNDSNQAGFSFYDSNDADLKFALNTGSWKVEDVASKNTQGLYTQYFTDPTSGDAIILYYDRTHNAVIEAEGTYGNFSFTGIANGGGQNLAVAENPLANFTFAWFQASSGNLQVTSE